MTGLFAPTEGRVSYPGATDHLSAGIRAISQEGTLCPNLTVLENLQVVQRDLTGPGWRNRARRRIMAALDRIFPGHRIRADTLVIDMTLAQQQMVEIAIGFAEGAAPARLVVLDEPTSSLDASIAAQLLAHVRSYCAAGGAVIFISHMLGEIFDAATRIVIMRDGRGISDRPAAEFTRQGLVDAMGHVAADDHQPSPAALARALGDKSTAIVRTPKAFRRGAAKSSGWPVWQAMDRPRRWPGSIWAKARTGGVRRHRARPLSRAIAGATASCRYGRSGAI